MSFTHTLEAVGLRKEYPGTVALHGLSARFEGGKVHALLGKNGAGKSTLVKILAGAVMPDSGIILVDGREVEIRSPREAIDLGIATVHQELSIVPGLTVAENILLGRLPMRRNGLIYWPTVNRRAEEILGRLGIVLNVRQKAGLLGVAQQQLLEIARAMSYDPAVLMLDEPTSALSGQETERLFTLLRALAARGVVLLYITHRLDEVPKIADTVTVLRNGRLVGAVPAVDATPAGIGVMMFGETVVQPTGAHHTEEADTLMEVRGLSRGSSFTDVSFALRRGEILGIAGLLGSGRTELLRAIFGADPPDAGTVVIDGMEIVPSSPAFMRRHGVALAPENRKEEGLVQILSTRTNLCLASLGLVARSGFLTAAREEATALGNVRELSITVPSVNLPVSTLSGGNQQKVVIAKWLNTGARVLLLDEPTRGVDIQAKQQVFQIVEALSVKGIGSIVVSSELEELMQVCHRILIMRKGRIVGETRPQQTSLQQLLAACMD